MQVFNEFTSVARRKHGFSWEQIEVAIQRLLQACAGYVSVTIDIHESARLIANRYQLNIYDANIVAAARSCDCSILYTEDMHDGLVIEDRLTIRNPFA